MADSHYYAKGTHDFLEVFLNFCLLIIQYRHTPAASDSLAELFRFFLSCKFLIKIHSQTSPCLWEVWPVLIGTVMLTQGSYTSRYSQEKKAEQHEDSWDKYSDPFSIPYKARISVKTSLSVFQWF